MISFKIIPPLLLLLQFNFVVDASAVTNTFIYPSQCTLDTVMDCYKYVKDNMYDTLRNKNIVFIGDSLTRYQYLSLMYSLRHGQPQDINMKPAIVNEGTWHKFKDQGWIGFFQGSRGLLQPFEQCDCSYYNGRFFENRYYHDPLHNITATYYMHRGQGIAITNNTDSIYAPEPQEKSAPMTNIEAIPFLLEHLPNKPDIIVANVGMFGFGKILPQEDYAQTIKKVAKIAIWKTSTYRFNEVNIPNYDKKHHPSPNDRETMDKDDAKMCSASGIICMDTSWTSKATETHYWNDVHFNEPIYTMLNAQLIGILRNAYMN